MFWDIFSTISVSTEHCLKIDFVESFVEVHLEKPIINQIEKIKCQKYARVNHNNKNDKEIDTVTF